MTTEKLPKKLPSPKVDKVMHTETNWLTDDQEVYYAKRNKPKKSNNLN